MEPAAPRVHAWGCPACVPSLQYPKQVPGCSACARRCAQGNAQFSALLRLAAGMHTPSIPFSPMHIPAVLCIRAICTPAAGSICSPPRNLRAAVVLILLLPGTAGSVGRDNHESSAKEEFPDKAKPFPRGAPAVAQMLGKAPWALVPIPSPP